MNIKTSGYGLIDITAGRNTLKKHIETGGRPVTVTIIAEIDSIFGNDDGVSREFVLDIKKMKVMEDK